MDSWTDPWGVGEVFGGEPFSRFGAFHPDAVQIRSDGEPTTIACLNQPAFRHSAPRQWIYWASDIGGRTVFWDEPTVYFADGVWGCRCAVCRSLWRDRHGGEMPTAYGPEAEAFIEQTMHDLLGDASLYARSKGMRNAVCIMPPEATNPGFRADRTGPPRSRASTTSARTPTGSASEGMPAEYVGRHAKATVEVATRHGLDHHVWIQAFGVPAGREGEIALAVDAAVGAGARNIAAWSYDGCAAMSTCACEDPAAAWSVVRQSFQRVRGRA